MSLDQMARNARRHIRKIGHDVVVRTITLGGEDAYNDETVAATNATISAIRRVMLEGQTRLPSGALVTCDAIFHVEDTATISAGVSSQPSEIVDGDSTFVVTFCDDQQAGVIALTTERKRY